MNLPIFSWMIIIPLVAGPVIYLAGRVGIHEDWPNRRGGLVQSLALAALLAAWVPYLFTLPAVLSAGQLDVTFAGIALRVDGLSLLMSGAVLALGTLVALYSGPYMAFSMGEEKYYAMLVTTIGVIVGLSCAGDLFNLWVWFEAMAVSSYLLVAFYRRQRGSLEAGIKYVVQSSVGSVLVLFGIALVLAQTGTLELAAIAANQNLDAWVSQAAVALFVIGFGVKVAIVPLHSWLPDAHSQAPSGISAMLSGVVIEAGLLALLRAATPLVFMQTGGHWGFVLMAFGALNMLYGNLLALRQQQVKRLLAYSSLSHVGYMLVGLGVALFAREAASSVAQQAAAGAFFHILTHALMKGLAFLAVGALMYAFYVSKDSHAPLMVADLDGAAQKYPWVALMLGTALLALGGMPPLAGFMSKWQIFVAGFQSLNGPVMSVVVFAALNSVLSLGYYAPLVNKMYRKQPGEAVQQGNPIPARLVIPLVMLTLAVIILGFWPSLANPLTEAAAAAMLK
ncbi:MAG: complex I subunit 5 family protein [Chloroflexota bacterium]